MNHVKKVLCSGTIAVSEFKKGPVSALGDNDVVCVLAHNAPAFYAVSPEQYERLVNATGTDDKEK